MRLIESGNAYFAFDTEQELNALRQKAELEKKLFQYDQRTRKMLKNSLTLSSSETNALIASGVPYVIRVKIPENEHVTVHDIIRGEVTVQTENLDDKVLFKSDGLPTYHLANVVDDYLMKITHVIRGEEWLPSAPLHVLLYRFFGWEAVMPSFAHLPLILKPDGNGKLSKRDGDRLGFPVFPINWKDPASGDVFPGYREAGYLPESVINILAHLGWNPGTEQEVFSVGDLIEQFSLDRVGRHGSKFDPEKARWFNHQYIQNMSDGDVLRLLRPLLQEHQVASVDSYILSVFALVRERMVLLPDFWQHAWFFFERPVAYDEQVTQKVWVAGIGSTMKDFSNSLEQLVHLDKESFNALVSEFVSQKGIKTGQLMNPLRLLMVGTNQGPGMADIVVTLGREEVLVRMKTGFSILPSD
jgi:glutamyl-tRNA synthetase